jgi:excisionase family DNA binding protein
MKNINCESIEGSQLGRGILEPYVSPEAAAEFLGISRVRVIRMARACILPAHPVGTGKRRQWRFRFSELDRYMQGGITGVHPPVRQ